MKTYDALVLGGGTAGTAAARALHAAGAKVALFNDGELGGLCILRGCMPTKTLLHAAHFLHEARHTRTPGVSASGVEFDFAEIMANKDAKVARFKRAKIDGIESAGYEVIDARARFAGEDTVEAGGETYRFTKGAVIATGSVPELPPIPGIEGVRVLSSDDAMFLEKLPDSMLVLGSGAIGLELAQFYARLGTEVHLVSRRRVGLKIDPDVADEMEAFLRAEPNLHLHQPCTPTAIEPSANGVRMTLDGERFVEGACFLAATGRRAAVDDLNLEAAGVRVDGGAIAHGPDMRSSNPRIFVTGDATGEQQLLHVANWEGAIAAANILDPDARREVEQRLTMEVIFTDPPLATLGQTEAVALANGYDPIVSLLRFPETGRAITMDVAHGISKLVADRGTGELLGAQLLGPRADDLIHILSVHMAHRGTAAQLLDMPWYHPTLAEVLLSQARELAAGVG